MSEVHHYFASLNGYNGAESLFEEIYTNEDMLYVLKGGPGNGKSTFMKKSGEHFEKAGYQVEYFHCAGDPDSIDAVRIPEKNIVFADGTAPHVIEPYISGYTGIYVDLSRFCKSKPEKRICDNMIKLENNRKQEILRAHKLLCAAGIILSNTNTRCWNSDCIDIIERRADGIAKREFKNNYSNGKVTVRALSAFTCKGLTSFKDTVVESCDKVYYIDNHYGMGPIMLAQLAERAVAEGENIVKCVSPFDTKLLEILLLPEKGMAFVCGCDYKSCKNIYRHIRLDALVKPEKKSICQMEKVYTFILEEAKEHLKKAKKLHDQLEVNLNLRTDFDEINEYTRKFLSELRV